jgi:hypothetical protein
LHKSSKIKGPVTEDIPEMAPKEQSIEYRDSGTKTQEITQESAIPIKNLIECPTPEPLEPEEVGIQIYVFAPKHSKSFKRLAARQFQEGKVTTAGTVLLPDGQTIRSGATAKTEMRPELKVMLRDGVFLAGKAPRRS